MAVLDAQGATLSIDNSGGTPQLIGQLKTFSGFDGAATEIDITNLASSAKEFRQGLQDEGSIDIEYQFDPADVGQEELRLARAAQATRELILTLASGDVATFQGFVVSRPVSGGVDEVVEGTSSIRITGAVVWT